MPKKKPPKDSMFIAELPYLIAGKHPVVCSVLTNHHFLLQTTSQIDNVCHSNYFLLRSNRNTHPCRSEIKQLELLQIVLII